MLQDSFWQGGNQLLRYFLNLVMLARPEDMPTNSSNSIATRNIATTVLAAGFLLKELLVCGIYLPASVNFSTLGSFKRSITDVDFINFQKYA